jgi:hypothetical protein
VGALALSAPAPAQQASLASPSVTIPFEDDFNLIWIPVVVNDADTVWFLLDTGFEYSLFDARTAASLGLAISDAHVVPQPGGDVEVGTVSAATLSLRGARLTDWTLQAVPLAALQPIVGRTFGGILGHDIVAAFVMTIDYDRRTLVLTDADGYAPPAAAAELPLGITNNEPFVEGTIVQPHRPAITGRFKIDTGSLDAIGLNANFLTEHDVLAPDQPTRSLPGIAVGGETDGVLFRIDGFRLGPFIVQHPVIGATLESGGFENRADAGTIGAEILRRFTVTLDYARERMFLEPSDAYESAPGTDRSGMWVMADGEDFSTFRVRFVLDESPAQEAGVRPDDIITAVNGRPASELRLIDIWRMLRREDGAVVELDLDRAGDTVSTRLVLRSPV